MGESRISQKAAERATGINRKTFQRWAKAGKISRDEKGKVLLSEIRACWTTPIMGTVCNTRYQFQRARSRPKKKPTRRSLRAPMRHIDAAAQWGVWEGIDFGKVRAAYCGLNLLSESMVSGAKRMKKGEKKSGLSEMLENIAKKQAVLRSAARKACLKKPISEGEKRRLERVRAKVGAGLPVLALPGHMDWSEFWEYLQERIEAERIEPATEVKILDLFFGRLNQIGEPFCRKLAIAYFNNEYLDYAPIPPLPKLSQLARGWGISPQAASRRIHKGLDSLAKFDKKLADDLKRFWDTNKGRRRRRPLLEEPPE